jgi:hypothetical protein
VKPARGGLVCAIKTSVRGGRLGRMAAKKKSKKKSRAKKVQTRKASPKKSAKKKTSRRKAAAKRTAKRTRATAAKPVRAKRRTRDESPESWRVPALSGDADSQGLSKVEDVDSESVRELIDEGNTFEAGVVGGVERADDNEGKEVRTREFPEDDVPEEYLDEQ